MTIVILVIITIVTIIETITIIKNKITNITHIMISNDNIYYFTYINILLMISQNTFPYWSFGLDDDRHSIENLTVKILENKIEYKISMVVG